jgi:hypothetical protein
MSDTPRTQNAFAIANLHENKRMKPIYDEMAKLERELSAMTQRRDELLASLEKVVKYLTISLPPSGE